MAAYNNDTATFHLQLLTKTLDMQKYPFIKLIIERTITNEEYDELFHLLHTLNSKYEVQKEDGLLDFSSLLIHFAGMLNEKLDPNETIFALKAEGYFVELMNTFIKIIEEDGRK
ncbi:DUF1878 family protein [Ornithinibacillus caprae]|uniref:DUF1878 family protein n=1 Tax=Ornithinibacillus caprae TaxID=2678566 RepID=UPI001FE52740|nr:DUF1878 family protein [Ornithinibacillus caprae]